MVVRGYLGSPSVCLHIHPDLASAQPLSENRALLLGALYNSAESSISATSLILDACLRHGENFPAFLDGDFAVAVWDARNRRLLLGRDALGSRGIWYWHSGIHFRFASSLPDLLSFPEIPAEPDHLQAAQWLMLHPWLGDRTFCRNVRRLPPGHVLILENNRLRLHRFWKPENLVPLRFSDPRDYACGLLERMRAAVTVRTPSNDPIASHLSGGLDSSAVTALAAEALASRGRQILSFTACPRHPPSRWLERGRFGDESSHAAAVAARWPNIRHHLVPNDHVPLFDALDFYSAQCLSPIRNPFNAPWLVGIQREAALLGATTLLVGDSGNISASFNSDAWALSGLLRSARLAEWLRLVAARRHFGHRTRSSLNVSLGLGAFSQMLRRGFGHIRRFAGNPEILRHPLFDVSAANPAFLRACGISRRRISDPDHVRARSLDDRLLVFRRSDPAAHFAAAFRAFGLELSDPLRDRRLAEYCLALPDEAFCLEGESRALIRHAMRGLLPPEILHEHRRGRQAADAHALLSANRREIAAEVERMKSSDLANRYLDMPLLTRLIVEWPQGDDWSTPAVRTRYEQKLLRAVSFGRFIRCFEDGSLVSAIRSCPPPPPSPSDLRIR